MVFTRTFMNAVIISDGNAGGAHIQQEESLLWWFVLTSPPSRRFSLTASSIIITASLLLHSFRRQADNISVKEVLHFQSTYFNPYCHRATLHQTSLGSENISFMYSDLRLHSLVLRFTHSRKGLLVMISLPAIIQLLLIYIKHTNTSFVEQPGSFGIARFRRAHHRKTRSQSLLYPGSRSPSREVTITSPRQISLTNRSQSWISMSESPS